MIEDLDILTDEEKELVQVAILLDNLEWTDLKGETLRKMKTLVLDKLETLGVEVREDDSISDRWCISLDSGVDYFTYTGDMTSDNFYMCEKDGYDEEDWD